MNNDNLPDSVASTGFDATNITNILKPRHRCATNVTRTLPADGDGSVVTIQSRAEAYDVIAAVEFMPNFVKHILAGDAVTVFDESGNIIGGNPGKATKLLGWNINHPDINNDSIMYALLRAVQTKWSFK